MIGDDFPPHRRWRGTDFGPGREVGDLLQCQVIGAVKSHGDFEPDSDFFLIFRDRDGGKKGERREGGVQGLEDGFMCGKWELGQVVQITGSRC